MSHRTGFYEAELCRLKGKITLQRENQKSNGNRQKAKIKTSTQHPAPSAQAKAEAEVYFLKAIEIARRQQAKSLALCASTSLARLRQQQNERKIYKKRKCYWKS